MSANPVIEPLILCADHYIKEVILGGSGAKVSTLKGPQAKSDKAFSHGHQAGLKAGIRNAIDGTATFKLEG